MSKLKEKEGEEERERKVMSKLKEKEGAEERGRRVLSKLRLVQFVWCLRLMEHICYFVT